jgi:hypothetical protein
VSPVTDKNGIAKDTWFLDERGIEKVMGEVIKVGSYFENRIPIWTSKIVK